MFNLIHKYRLAIKSHIVCANYTSFSESQYVFHVSIDLKANINGSLFDKKDFFDFFDRSVYHGANGLTSWLKFSQQVDHELSVTLIVPGQKGQLTI